MEAFGYGVQVWSSGMEFGFGVRVWRASGIEFPGMEGFGYGFLDMEGFGYEGCLVSRSRMESSRSPLLLASWTSREKSECQYANMLPCTPQEIGDSLPNNQR